MIYSYWQEVSKNEIAQLAENSQWAEAYDLLAQPLHAALYTAQDFALLDKLSDSERLIITFDYVQTQVGQGGFIQLIQNGYVRLLVPAIETMQTLHIAPDMVAVLDDALKVFVLNKDILGKETSVEEFGKLYAEFREFEVLESRFNDALSQTLRETVSHTIGHDNPA